MLPSPGWSFTPNVCCVCNLGMFTVTTPAIGLELTTSKIDSISRLHCWALFTKWRGRKNGNLRIVFIYLLVNMISIKETIQTPQIKFNNVQAVFEPDLQGSSSCLVHLISVFTFADSEENYTIWFMFQNFFFHSKAIQVFRVLYKSQRPWHQSLH